MDLTHSTAVITGGASGLGFSTAQFLISKGANVALLDISEEQGHQSIAALNSNRAKFIKVDVREAEEVQNALREVQTTFGPIHLCLNCAG
ncbi:SDR family NAD(P)-dependent oxidoreductase, partial [Alteromonas sp. 14N.309.X.WAT.G.H12]|uniref:SDR family NAD(P)-dependent oxidoreductase n=1 Tax=Alteromonas sp. 14N.309.X.WAT.G.H12 TaxID=3120824 RepID=UPI002FD45D12